jgi:multiple sugar transport system substrate-binding protein
MEQECLDAVDLHGTISPSRIQTSAVVVSTKLETGGLLTMTGLRGRIPVIKRRPGGPIMQRRAHAAIALLAMLAFAPTARAEAPTQITMWSNWPDEPAKKDWVTARVADFQAAQQQCTVKLTFMPKADIYTQLKSTLRIGHGPDVFYMDPDAPEFVEGGFMEPLDTYIDLAGVEDWARPAWTYKGKLYGIPVEAYTVELYYNTEMMKKLGIALPPSGQLNQSQFTDLVRKGVAAGITPVAAGVGDRPYPGAFLTFESLLRKLGPEDYGKLLHGTLSYLDPRVMEVLTWMKSLIDAGAYPKSISTLKLGEAHFYFYSTPGALTFPDPSWFTGRAFAAPEKGGMPTNFPLGIMQFPAMDNGACPTCKTLAVGGSFTMYSKSPHKACAGALLRSMATVENGTKWMEQVALQTGIRSDPTKIKSPHAAYFVELNERDRGARYFFGIPLLYYRAKCADTYSQVMNSAFPAGLIGAHEAANAMDSACLNPAPVQEGK